jgi:hypothetical protein
MEVRPDIAPSLQGLVNAGPAQSDNRSGATLSGSADSPVTMISATSDQLPPDIV